MSASSDLKDFMIGIGFTLDNASASKATAGHAAVEKRITTTNAAEVAKREKAEETAADKRERARKDEEKKSREGREKTIRELQTASVQAAAFAIKAVTAVEATALGIAYAVDKAAASFERLNYLSKQSGASPTSMTAFGFAASQLGSTAGAADSFLQTFGTRLKMFPGYRQALQRLIGNVYDANGGLQDTGELATRLGEKLREIQKTNGPAAAVAQANVFGPADYQLVQTMSDERFRGVETSRTKQMGNVGANPDEAAKAGTAFEQSMRNLRSVVDDIALKISTNLSEKIQPVLDQLAKWAAAHGKEIADRIVAIADSVIDLATSFARVSDHLLGDGGMIALLGLFGVTLAEKVLSPLSAVVAAVRLLGGMALPPWVLALLGLGIGAAAVSKSSADLIQGSKPGSNDVYVDPETGLATKVVPGAGNQVEGVARPGQTNGPQDAADRAGTVKARDSRNWWQRHAPSILGGQDAPVASVPAAPAGAPPGAASAAVDHAVALVGDNIEEAGRDAGATMHVGAWCADFTNAMMKSAGVKGVDSSMALAFSKWGHAVGAKDVKRGDVMVFDHGGGHGHVGMATGLVDKSGRLQMISGNHGHRVGLSWESPDSLAALRRANEAPALPPAPRFNAAMGRAAETVRAASGPFGALDHAAFVGRPLTSTSSTSIRGDVNLTHNPTYNIKGPDMAAAMNMARLSASRGQQDLLRNVQGAEQ